MKWLSRKSNTDPVNMHFMTAAFKVAKIILKDFKDNYPQIDILIDE